MGPLAAPPPRRLARAALAFVALGLLLYAALYACTGWLLPGDAAANPFRRIHAAPARVDWVVLGSSHAMPLGFGGFTERLRREAGSEVLNLGTQGAGPLYSRLVLEHFLAQRSAGGVLYVADSFAFQAPLWNEERIADGGLLSHTPWDAALAARMASYVLHEDVSWRGWLDYTSGFARVNSRSRLRPDRWAGESLFEDTWRPSASAVRKRIAYLYPAGMQAATQARYLAQLGTLLRAARAAGAQAVVVKLPLTRAFREALPAEKPFDDALERTARDAGAAYLDLGGEFDDPAYFFDSDHLNRAGVAALLERRLKAVLAPRPRP